MTSGNFSTAARKASRQAAPWSAASIPTKTVRPKPSLAGSAKATRRIRTPVASSFWIRFQQGVCDSPTRSAIWAMGCVASCIRAATIFRSIRSRVVMHVLESSSRIQSDR
mgnify:CR=1 FL=1